MTQLQTNINRFLDLHLLSPKEVDDFDYLESLISNYEENLGEELDGEEVVACILNYQHHYEINKK